MGSLIRTLMSQHHSFYKMALTIFSFFITSMVQAIPVGHQWQWAQPTGGGNRIESIAYNGTSFVAVGYAGLVRVSSNGFSWTDESRMVSSQVSDHKIIWAGGQFVIVGDGGRIKTSDGSNFFVRTSNTTENLRDVVFDGSQYVVVGDNSTILTSADGVSWIISTGPAGMGSIEGIEWNGSFFVTVSSNGNIYTSPDAINWAQEPTPAALPLNDIVWNGSQWLAVGSPAVVYTSPDGVNWTQQSAPPGIINIRTVIWDGTQYITVGDDGYIVRSSDGVSWLNVSTSVTLLGVGQGGGFYDLIALGTSLSSGKYFVVGTGGTIFSSVDLGQWNLRSTIGLLNIDRYDAVAFNGSLFVATGKLADVVTSTDGISWSKTSTKRYVDVLWNGSQFVAVADDGRVGVSTNGVSWSETTLVASLLAIGKGHNNVLVATGFSGKLFTSSDSINWTEQTSGTSNQLTSTANNGSMTVVVGVDTILTSTDSVNWSSQSLPDSGFYPLTKVIYANGEFVVVGSQGVVITSTDGINWNKSTVNNNWWSRGINWTGFEFIAAGDNGNIMTSIDALNWTQPNIITDNDLMDIAGNDKVQVAVGQFGALLYSVAVNEAPVPTAAALITNEDTLNTVQIMANDPDFGETFTYSVTANPSDGMATVDSNGLASYTPNTNFNGSDGFAVQVTDSAGLTGVVNVAVTVNAINDAPAPSAATLTTDEDTIGTVQILANDPDLGDSFSYSITVAATNGTATVDINGMTTYTPDANFNGSDNFSVQVTDAAGLMGVVDVLVAVTAVNDAPVASAPAISVTAGNSATSQISASDIDTGDTLSYAITTNGSKGTATVSGSGLVSYSANSGSTGSDSLVITVTDSAGATVDVTITINITAASTGGGSSSGSGGGGSFSYLLFLLLIVIKKLK